MKLNIGCGHSYRKGYVNIDAFDDTVADKVMSATDLRFQDLSVSHIDCIQVIEHLGLAGCIYALAEMYRVLELGGTLLLETPDLLTSFKKFAKSDSDGRKMLLNWIYGLDSPGMSHRYGFPKELLDMILQECGFEDVRYERIYSKTLNPSLRVSCRKRDSQPHQALAHLRKDLVRESIVNLEDQVDIIEKEELIQKLMRVLLNEAGLKEESMLIHLVETASIASPRIGKHFIESMQEGGLLGRDVSTKYLKVLDELHALDFIAILIHLLMEMPITPGKQNEAFQSVSSMAKQVVRKVVRDEPESLEDLAETAKSVFHNLKVEFFSQTVLRSQANSKLAEGIKSFAVNDLKAAEEKLRNAVQLDRDLILAFWNLARVYSQMNESKKARQYHTATRQLLVQQFPKRRDLIQRIEQDLAELLSDEISALSDPIHDLR